jgi:integrase
MESLRLLESCGPTLYVMVALALTTGLRRENIFHLKWSEIEDNVLTIKIKRGKTLSLPLSPQVVLLLEKHKRAMRKKGAGNSEWVFPTPNDFKKPKTDQANSGLNRAFKLANLPYSGWHILRHTFASSFLKSVGNLVLLQNILGHSNIAQTSRYAHIDMGQKKKALEEHALRSLPVITKQAPIAQKITDSPESLGASL